TVQKLNDLGYEILYPPYSPDFFVDSINKLKVYQQRPTTPENIANRIINACASISPDTIESVSLPTDFTLNT
ncbi:hypothetical protein WH47_07047, partial [Habropoda laboriosa]